MKTVKIISIGMLSVLLAMPAAAWCAGKARPNILWIITDDQRSDSLGCYNRATTGKPESALGYVESTHLDRLAAEGVLFTNAFCNSMACAPSRSSMHTGKYPHHCGMYGFRKAHQAADCASRVIPEVMKAHGYQPSMFGKSGYYIFDWQRYHQWAPLGYYQPFVHRNKLEKTPGSDFWFNKPWGRHNGKGMVLGREEVFRYADGSVKRFWTERVDRAITADEKAIRRAVEEELDILRTYTRRNPELIIGGVSPNTTWRTLDGTIVKCFKTYLENEGKTYQLVTGETARGPDPQKPIFVHLGFCLPHTPVLPSKEFRDRFAGKQYRVPAYSPKEAALMPPSLRDLRDDMDFSRMKPGEKQQAIRDYYALCAMGDHLIGAAVDSFKKYCRRHGQEYLIIYVCGDHGWHLGEQGIEAKFGPWFQTVHDSAIVVSSDKSLFPAGKVCKDMVEFVDFAPTFYEAAGIDAGRHPGLDGISLRTTLRKGPQRDYVIGEMNQVRGDRAYLRCKDFAFAMRVRPFWKKPGEGYEPGERIRWGLEAPAEEVDMSLYDLRIDPDERINVAYHKPYVKLAAFLRNKLGRIVLGDGRVECDWTQENKYHVSNFARGAHDRALEFPPGIVPEPKLPDIKLDRDDKAGQKTKIAQVTFRKLDNGVDVFAGQRKIAGYVHTEKPLGRPFICNIHTLDGIQVTRNYPVTQEDQQDHPHHQGLFHTFSQVNGIDYWHMKGITRHRRLRILPEGGSSAGFATESVYLDRDRKSPLLKQEMVHEFHVTPMGLLIMVDAIIEAEAEQVILGSKEEGGLAVRMSSDLQVKAGGVMTDSHGRSGGKAIWGKTARWVDNSGRKNGRWVGVTLLTHPDNAGPFYWHARDYGLLTANPLGPLNTAPDRILKKGQSLSFRYGVMVHSHKKRGDYSPADAQTEYVRRARPVIWRP